MHSEYQESQFKIEGTQQDKDDLPLYAQLWKKEPMKQYLKEKVQQRYRSKGTPKKITENDIITEYWRYWHTLEHKDSIKKLMSHPALTQQDLDTINQVVIDNRYSHLKWSFVATAATLGIYTLFLKKLPFFYNLFAPTKSSKTVRILKKGSLCIVLFYSWAIGLNQAYESKIPHDIQSSHNLFKKYMIDYSDSFYIG